MTIQNMRFTFSDSIAGYVVSYDEDADSFGLRTSDGREFKAFLTPETYALIVRNFGEGYLDATGQLRDMLVPNRLLFVYGIFYPEGEGYRYDVKQVIFPGAHSNQYAFEQPSWWANQAKAIGDFYLRGQFPDGNYDWRNYRTKLSLSGTHTPDYISPDFRQETDTISRLVYGLASAYLLTGEDRFLEAAESGTEYLREHMRGQIESEGVVFWYHGMDVSGDNTRKIFASQFGDDYDAIPMYEQIYALAGPTQTYRITGDPRILDDINKTVELFDRFFRDPNLGGYFSHIDPVTLDPRSDSLGPNRARKNWNSVGDHAPAYLINALLATGRKDLEDFLVHTGETIESKFPDDANSPFVQERFHEDWSHDRKYRWQQDNAVVGHNLKIAWNLMRIHHRRPNQAFVALANKIADTMPAVGSDQQRGGWYDTVERVRKPGEEWHRFVWHDRKAWWQQEQAILAYYILAGSLGNPEHLRYAREAAAFYNVYFLDQDEGGVYFNVFANGNPYLTGGNERLKGSHSMSGYHSIELCYLAATYINLLVSKEPMELHFKPKAASFPDGVLRVAPDLLPPGSIRLTDVWVDDEPYTDFDADACTVRLPEGKQVKVRARITPTTDKFDTRYETHENAVRITLRGDLDPDVVPILRRELERAIATNLPRVILHVKALRSMSDEAIRELLFLRQKMELMEQFCVIGPNEAVAAMFDDAGDAFRAGGEFICVDDEAQLP